MGVPAVLLMLVGIGMVCQPFFQVLFRWGFLVTLAGIVGFGFASHMKGPPADGSE